MDIKVLPIEDDNFIHKVVRKAAMGYLVFVMHTTDLKALK